MPNAIPEDQTLKLYSSEDGEVWFIDGNSPPKPSGYSSKEVSTKLRLVSTANKPIRISGGMENVSLIVDLYDSHKAGHIPHLELCSPQVNRIDLDSKTPEKVLINMRNWKYPSSIGGYRPVDDRNIVSYRLANELLDLDKALSPEGMSGLLCLYAQHPCYEYLKFIPFINDESCIITLALILDPRWYVDLTFPNKLHNYYEHMGVGRMISEPIYSVLSPKSSVSLLTKIQRRNAVLNSWQTPISAIASAEGYSFYDNFLVMTYTEAHKSFNIPKSDSLKFDAADLLTCQKFLAYVYYTWLNSVYESQPWGEALFVPEMFFTSDTEATSFKNKFCRKV